MLETHAMTKQINQKVHEQRPDLVEINHNVDTALTNAEEAEQNIEEAEGHQKSGGKCMCYAVAVVAGIAVVVTIIIVISLT